MINSRAQRFSRFVKKPVNAGLVADAQKQLVRALKFSLAFLPEVPSNKLDIKPVMAFPESLCSAEFCEDCSRSVLSLEDVNEGPVQILKKLSVGPESVTNDSMELFLKACSRLIGKESLLHVGYRTLADKFRKGKERNATNIARMERELIMLSPEQRKVLRTLQTNQELKYFCFVGGSGTGKTQLSLLTVDHLIKRYQSRDPAQRIHVYLTYKQKNLEENIALHQTFGNFGSCRSENVELIISKFEDLGEMHFYIEEY